MKDFRLIHKDEFQNHKYYAELYPLACSFGHQIVEVHEVWRWRPNPFAVYLNGQVSLSDGRRPGVRGKISIDQLWTDLYEKKFDLKPEHVMKYYMGIGYDLGGFQEVFSQKDASSFYDDAKEDQDLLTYVIQKWNGKVAIGIV